MYDRILVPTDGSDHSEAAAVHAFMLARAFDADVDVVSVVDLADAAGPFNAGGVDDEFVERLEAEAREAVDSVDALADDETSVRTEIREGAPAPVLLDYVDERDIELVVMGTHGRSGISRYVLGSVAEKVVRHAPVPVFTTRASEQSDAPSYDRVLVPTDGSSTAGVAVEHAVEIAAAFDATAHALSVVDIGTIAAQSDITPATAVYDQLKQRAIEATEDIADRGADSGVEVITEVREGFPEDAILEYAGEIDADLIVMGTHGRSGVGRFLLGSTTERAIRNADQPVLAVRKADQ